MDHRVQIQQMDGLFLSVWFIREPKVVLLWFIQKNPFDTFMFLNSLHFHYSTKNGYFTCKNRLCVLHRTIFEKRLSRTTYNRPFG